MPEWYEICQICRQEYDFSRSAIAMGDGEPQYQPFMEDWRAGYVKIAHPKCFAETEGTDALLAAVERNDRRIRGYF